MFTSGVNRYLLHITECKEAGAAEAVGVVGADVGAGGRRQRNTYTLTMSIVRASKGSSTPWTSFID